VLTSFCTTIPYRRKIYTFCSDRVLDATIAAVGYVVAPYVIPTTTAAVDVATMGTTTGSVTSGAAGGAAAITGAAIIGKTAKLLKSFYHVTSE
jgi:hypothetical protein